MVYEIYSIGDGQFLERVLQGLAMMANQGTLTAVGAIGLTLGLIATSLRGVLSAGRDFPVMGSFVGLVLFMALFVPKVSVQIDDLNAVPGQKQLRTRVVDHVPFGAAAAGALVSKIGVALTELLETAFSTVDGARITDGGFGHTLDVLASGRELIAGKLRRDEPYAEFAHNLGSYLRDCTLTGVHHGRTRIDDLLNRPPWAAIEYRSAWASTQQVGADGNAGDVTCDDAYRALGDRWPAAKVELLAEFDRGVGITRSGGRTYEEQLRSSLAGLAQQAGLDSSDYLVASAIAAEFDRALAGSPLNSQASANAILITQALAQRQTQWAAEENLFLKVMRPTMAFFEAVIYAVVPFMAFLLGFGSHGIALILRYLVLTLWVQLWLPVLAIVNLYQCTQVEHYVAAMHLGSATGGTIGLGEWIGLMNAAADWLATGSTLAAATPAITLSLLYGGAVTATSLAGRLGGSDHVDEKIASPDLVGPAPMLAMAAMKQWNPQTGVTTTGGTANLPQLSMQEMSRHAESDAAQQLSSATLAAMQTLDRTVTSGHAAEVAHLHAFADSFQRLSSETESRLTHALMEEGLSRQDAVNLQHQWQSRLLLAAGGGVSGDARLGGDVSLKGGLTGSTLTRGMNKAIGRLAEVAIGLSGTSAIGANAHADVGGDSSDSRQRGIQFIFGKDWVDRIAASTNLQLALGNAAAEAESAATSGSATERVGIQGSTRLARDLGRLEQSARQFSEVQERSAQFTVGQSINVGVLGHLVAADARRFDELVGTAQTFEPREFQRQRERLAVTVGIDDRAGAHSGRALDAAAAIVTLSAAVNGGGSAHATAMHKALVDAAGGYFASDFDRADRPPEFAEPTSDSAKLLKQDLDSHVHRADVGSRHSAGQAMHDYRKLHEQAEQAHAMLSGARSHAEEARSDRHRQSGIGNQQWLNERREQHERAAAQAFAADGSGELAREVAADIDAVRSAVTRWLGGGAPEEP